MKLVNKKKEKPVKHVKILFSLEEYQQIKTAAKINLRSGNMFCKHLILNFLNQFEKIQKEEKEKEKDEEKKNGIQ